MVKFFYNDKGQRVRKEVLSGNTKTEYYIRDAAGSVMAIYNATTQTEVPIYGASRLGMFYRNEGTPPLGEPEGDYVYQLTDHLGNIRAVIAKEGNNAMAVTSATDYYPFGMPMPNRQMIGGELYRYAYQGQEKDPETGKEAFQLRLWDGRIGRWLTTDPAGQYSSPYLGMGNNPINGVDPDGAFFGPPTDFKNKQTGETVHVNDGINQVIEIENSQWMQALNLSAAFSSDFVSFKNYSSLQNLIASGTPRSDLFYTINNVLKGQSLVKYGSFSKNCFTCATRQELNNGGSPGDKFDRVDLWVLNNSGLKENMALAENSITNILLSGHSVVTGVNRQAPSNGNLNTLTNHFVNIVGQGNDKHGNFYMYYDNISNSTWRGDNTLENRFRPWNGRWKDMNNWSRQPLTITEIRLNN